MGGAGHWDPGFIVCILKTKFYMKQDPCDSFFMDWVSTTISSRLRQLKYK